MVVCTCGGIEKIVRLGSDPKCPFHGESEHDRLKNKVTELERKLAKAREALELILESEVLRHSPFVGYSEAIANARKALKEIE